ncbi:uncharacterized protein LOC112502865 [Cynara cardunculus var. scolymus]|uniref:uncharacterized protein LOC112502865 n=1 Tax=Cynara cardunculus var. scolymus TaxID=59895 RepID=UPI000D630D35|nr:uncharacterized protein LOC112502865 [Cynara cardunculus var. scolymus]
MPLRDDLSSDLSLVKDEVNDVKKLLSRLADDKEGEKDLVVVVPTTPTDVDAQVERAEANEANAITSHEAEAVAEVGEIDDVVIEDEDADENNDDDDEDDDPSSFPDAGKDIGGDDDEDGDDDDLTIQYHNKPASSLKGVSLRDSSSQGEKE